MKKKTPDFLRIFALLVSFLLIIYFWFFAFIPKTIPNLLKFFVPGHKINILVMGLDYSYDEKDRVVNLFRTDTMILLCADPYEGKIKILSIPRDSLVDIPGSGFGKINKAYALGKEDLAKETVSQFLGVDIDGYITILPTGLTNIVDSLGGVKVYVDQNMFYTDNWGHFKINLKKGLQKLDGYQAQGYVRFRHDKLGDIGRIKRQQEFLKILFRKLASPSSLVRLPVILDTVSKSFRTDLGFYEMLKIGNMARMSEKNDIAIKTLPGSSPGSSPYRGYWIVDEKEKSLLLKDLKIR